MIDSHCHLTAKEFVKDLDEVVLRAKDAGVEKIITISDAMADIEPCIQLSEKYPQIFFTTGVHPHHAKDFSSERDLPLIKKTAAHKKCRAIGEIGLDYHYMWSPKDTQQRVFEAQIALALELKLPAVVHCREAVEDVWTIVNHVKGSKVVVHCCTEKWSDVKRFVEAGHFLSFTGIATYPRSDDIRETLRNCPLSQLMIETDGPYLAPVPYRGKRNEPAFVAEVLKCVADVKGISAEEADRTLTTNTLQFFGLPS